MTKRRRPSRAAGPVGPAPSVAEVRAGPAPEFAEPGGRVWRLGWNDQDAKACLEALVVSHAIEEAMARVGGLSAEAGLAYFTHFQNRVDAGQYHTFADGWKYVMAGPDASWLFLLSLLRHKQPQASPEDAKRLLAAVPEKVRLAVGVVAPDFFEAVVRRVGVEPTATAEQIRGVAERIAAAVLEKYGPPAGTAAPATGSP